MASSFKQIEDKLKTEAKKLLKTGQVSVVLAYGKGYDEYHPMPYMAKLASDADNIVFNEYCTHNLARYLVRYPKGTKIAIAVKAADSRAVIQLIQEEKVKREDLILLGLPAYGMKNSKTGEVIDSQTTCGFIATKSCDTPLTRRPESVRAFRSTFHAARFTHHGGRHGPS